MEKELEERIRNVKVGDPIVYHDPVGKAHNAICTANWGMCINFVYVSSDESKTDQYGRQIERQTSMSHASANNVHGFYWRFLDEEPNPYKPPVSI